MCISNKLGSLFAAAVLLLVSWLTIPSASADPSTPTPRVSVAPQGQHGFPFGSSALDLGKLGYVEQEFLVSGTARAYTTATPDPLQPDGRWNVIPNPGVIAPYTTRILVRRPIEPENFNGTVVVEWINATGASDTQSDWLYMHDEITRQGFVYVGVTTQYVGVLALLAWESGPGARYASLFHPGDSFSYDIFAQAGGVITRTRNGDPRPLGNLTGAVRRVLATGFSQSAWWLTTYVNAIHRLNPVYGGFLIDDGGIDSNLSFSDTGNGDPPPPGVPPTPDIATPYPFQLRTDQNVPTLILESEFGLSDNGLAAGRTFHLQSDTPHIRVWEFAGAPHLESGWFQELAADANKSTPPFILDPCDGPPGIPSIVHTQGSRAVLHALNEWAGGGMPPRSAPRLSLFVPDPPDDFSQMVTFHRDPATNLTIGGIRLPAVAVPIATLDGDRSDLDPLASGPGGQCGFIGSYDPWNHDSDPWDGQPGFDPSPVPEPDLQQLYSTHQSYVQHVAAAALQSTLDGYLRPVDAEKIVLDAAKAPVP
jgi:hypothetical protein